MDLNNKIAILANDTQRSLYVDPLQRALGNRLFPVGYDQVGSLIQHRPDLLITLTPWGHIEWPIAAGLMLRYRHQKIPVLQIIDGIIEWRQMWQRPEAITEAKVMPHMQPILADKLAVLGRSHIRLFESWGEIGKCEAVGDIRFDSLLGCQPRERTKNQVIRILVATAKTPGFDIEQINLVKRSIADIKVWFEQNRSYSGIKLEPVWRLTAGFDRDLGVENRLTQIHGTELEELFTHVDAVITTPSTLMLQAMLVGLPVALIDYTNSPMYVPAAWMITAPRHIEHVIRQLICRPTARMLYQDTILHDCLECRTPAMERMIELINKMIQIGKQCRLEGKELCFPLRLLDNVSEGFAIPEQRFDLASLYPGHTVFSNMDRIFLQVELGHYRIKASQLLTDIASFQQKISETQQVLAETQQALAETQQALAETQQALAEREHKLESVRHTIFYRIYNFLKVLQRFFWSRT